MSRLAAFPGIDVCDYARDGLHAPDRIWVEKNCYVDIWIELLHALGFEARAMLGFTVGIDFEGDQWTFFKPSHEDLRALYGVDVQELYVWRPLLEHTVEHLGAGRLISTEADAFWLPDTAGTDYRHQHTKTTIVLNAVDVEAQRLEYFHNAGYYALEGEDFVKTFRLDAEPDPAYLPLFAELVRQDRRSALGPVALRAAAREVLRKYVLRLPTDNPLRRFRPRFERDLPEISRHGLLFYHAWVFGTVRQLGAAAELTALHLEWLEPGSAELAPAIAAYSNISTVCKSLILKIARAVNSKRPLDASASFEDMATSWDQATAVLRAMS